MAKRGGVSFAFDSESVPESDRIKPSKSTKHASNLLSTADFFSGWLLKYSNYFSGFKSRWFVLQSGYLSYYRQPHNVAGVCRGTMNLSAAKVVLSDVKGFIVSSGNQTYHLKASSEDERDQWVALISRSIGHAFIAGTVISPKLISILEQKLEELAKNSSAVKIQVQIFEKKVLGLKDKDIREDFFGSIQTMKIAGDIIDKTSKEVLECTRQIMSDTHRQVTHAEVRLLHLENMIREMGRQHAMLEDMVRQAAQEISTKQSGKDSDPPIEKEEEYFDALTDEATQDFIELPVLEKIVKEEKHTQMSDDEEERANKCCMACIFKQNSSRTKSTEFRHKRIVVPRKNRRTSVAKPSTPRRSAIPSRPEGSHSLWSILKSFVGKDLTRVSMPVFLNEPLSFLQRITEDLEYTECLDKAATCLDRHEQMAYVAAFAVSSYATTTERTLKPFNPLLGETYECDRTKEALGWKSITEQVSHHPPILAFLAEGKGWKMWQQMAMVSKFKGNYLEIYPKGSVHVQFSKSGYHYKWNKVDITVHNIVFGQLWIDNHGELNIVNLTTNDHCVLEFKQPKNVSAEQRKVAGLIRNESGSAKYILEGTWDDQLLGAKVLMTSISSKGMPTFNTSTDVILWQRQYSPIDMKEEYNFTVLAVELNEMEANVAPTDSRHRPDQRMLENGKIDEADKLKTLLEEKQRATRRMMEASGQVHVPKWFKLDIEPDSNEEMYLFTNEYWQCKKGQNWARCPNIYLDK